MSQKNKVPHKFSLAFFCMGLSTSSVICFFFRPDFSSLIPGNIAMYMRDRVFHLAIPCRNVSEAAKFYAEVLDCVVWWPILPII
jgi:hypothetical protein